jgi:hypothetical protein
MHVAWASPAGHWAPEHFDARGEQWLRTFGGGLLATCGLDTFGPPSADAGEELGQHGRIGAVPGHGLAVRADARAVSVEGQVRQARLFGENLVLRRRVSSRLLSSTLRVRDHVTNEGFAPAPHMMLYHMNLGWPLIDEEAHVAIPAIATTPRDEAARAGMSEFATMGRPRPQAGEQVFLHDLPAETQVQVTIRNPRLGLAVHISFPSQQLPWLYQWKLAASGAYVMGIEPANCPVIHGRRRAREEGVLPMLSPGETVTYRLDVTFERLGQGSRAVADAAARSANGVIPEARRSTQDERP